MRGQLFGSQFCGELRGKARSRPIVGASGCDTKAEVISYLRTSHLPIYEIHSGLQIKAILP